MLLDGIHTKPLLVNLSPWEIEPQEIISGDDQVSSPIRRVNIFQDSEIFECVAEWCEHVKSNPYSDWDLLLVLCQVVWSFPEHGIFWTILLGSGESGVPQNYITPSKLRRFHLAIVNTIIIIINQPMSLSITDGEHHSSTQDPFIIPLISLWYPQLWYSQLWQSSMYLMVTYTWVMPKCCESLLLASVFRLLMIVRYAPWFGKSSLHLLENMQFQASSQWYRARAKISGQDAISKTQDQRPQCDSFTKAPLRATNFSQETISGCCLFALSHTSFYSASCFHFITFYIS